MADESGDRAAGVPKLSDRHNTPECRIFEEPHGLPVVPIPSLIWLARSNSISSYKHCPFKPFSVKLNFEFELT
jgi:hypothetical protein